MLILKLLYKIPRPILLKFGYSKIGSKLVKIFRARQLQKSYDVGYGVKMFLDITNPHTWELIGGREQEVPVKKTLMNNINEGDTIIDVGANMGEFSIIAAKKVGQKGRVISIEPLKQAVSWLEKNLTLNCFSNYEILEKAIGKNKGIMTLYQKSESSQHGILDPDISEKKLVNAGEIIVDTIDDIISSRNITKVEMLKIDVEGFEYEVLCGCKNSFKENKIKKIICEIHSKFLKKKGLDKNSIYAILKENGFSISALDSNEERPHILATLSKV